MTSDESGVEREDVEPVIVRISATAHLASGFGALGLLAVVLAVPWTAPLLVIPVIASAMIVRLRTVADVRTVTARTLLSSRTVDWADIKGLRFVKRTIPQKRSDKCCAGACKHDAFPSFFLQFNSLRISRNSKTPLLPTTHRAARSAPCANPSRLRAVWRSVMVSAAESKPISCVPGFAPARLALRLTGRA